MRIVKKNDLELVDGMLVEKGTGKCIVLPGLADEVNEITDMAALIAFVKDNKAAIEAGAKGHDPIVFKPFHFERPVLELAGAKPATPLNDAAKAEAEAMALEFLDVRVYENVNSHLLRYGVVAEFLARDYVMDEDSYDSMRFKTDPLLLDEDTVVAIVSEYNDPAIKKLVNSIEIGR